MTTDRLYQQARQSHWDAVARRFFNRKGGAEEYYHRRLAEVYQSVAAPGQRVLEIGCGYGDLLAALQPSFGVGIDFSPEMIRHATQRHPGLHFIEADAHALSLNQQFDIIILSDLVNDLWDVQAVFEQIGKLATPHTRLICNFFSRLWEAPLAVAQQLGLSRPNLEQNWLTPSDVQGLLYLADFEVIRHWQEILWPLSTPLLDTFFNRFVVKLWPFRYLGLTNFIVARPVPVGTAPTNAAPKSTAPDAEPLVSVIIPARNEEGNIEQIFARVPEMGRGTELIFVEGHSKDNTYAALEKAIAAHPERRCQLLRQSGVGKGDAVRFGFAQATGDIFMILDADVSVPPEDLVRFYEVLRSGKAEFANGVRLVYPMEEEAMRFLNLLGNKFFGLAFSWLLGQPIKDTLCGTKVLSRASYELIAANRAYFGDFDPFGDFDLLLGAARQNLKIVDVPIRYRQRTYG
ncbi:MAG TPA: glycosyltransferase, partial [Abditibacteriaceae bacterium]|nr:glycosyltransferase [Abditibacteriaceae bacterium]